MNPAPTEIDMSVIGNVKPVGAPLIFGSAVNDRVFKLCTYVLWLIATTTGTPNFLALLMCFATFGIPLRNSSRFSSVYSLASGAPGVTAGPPPCIFSALTVVTRTTAVGDRPSMNIFRASMCVNGMSEVKSQDQGQRWVNLDTTRDNASNYLPKKTHSDKEIYIYIESSWITAEPLAETQGS
ncbi:unnamed protein product [Acanthoscelides obtectus]|uniref:Uncharacterized protein n=1 Tax=Acanthoscelides obtectus TaxID=200917 RepID=A0A9P0PEB5_ACAOB|nr:unnamed protein product [Acanthoscelides obtectus]CAK1684492.1 hypothetical protein AOBTE_LOCUS34884 [Acanthoscelides obtectus]